MFFHRSVSFFLNQRLLFSSSWNIFSVKNFCLSLNFLIFDEIQRIFRTGKIVKLVIVEEFAYLSYSKRNEKSKVDESSFCSFISSRQSWMSHVHCEIAALRGLAMKLDDLNPIEFPGAAFSLFSFFSFFHFISSFDVIWIQVFYISMCACVM